MIPENATISVEEVIARCKMDLRLADTTEHDSTLEILIREALGSLNCLSQLEKKQCTLTADDNTMKLPPDMVKFIALRPKSWLPAEPGQEPPVFSTNINCGRFLYADSQFLQNCGCENMGFVNYQFGFQINKGYIHFNSTIGIDEATIAYFGLWLDDKGKPVVFERFERALTAYACWKFTRSWFEKYNQYIMESYQREWVLQYDKLRGQDVKSDFDRNKLAISELMRALIVSPITLAYGAP